MSCNEEFDGEIGDELNIFLRSRNLVESFLKYTKNNLREIRKEYRKNVVTKFEEILNEFKKINKEAEKNPNYPYITNFGTDCINHDIIFKSEEKIRQLKASCEIKQEAYV